MAKIPDKTILSESPYGSGLAKICNALQNRDHILHIWRGAVLERDPNQTARAGSFTSLVIRPRGLVLSFLCTIPRPLTSPGNEPFNGLPPRVHLPPPIPAKRPPAAIKRPAPPRPYSLPSPHSPLPSPTTPLLVLTISLRPRLDWLEPTTHEARQLVEEVNCIKEK